MKLSELRKLQQALPAGGYPPDPQILARELHAMGYDINNLYQELEMDSKFVDTHQDTTSSNAMLSLHSHSFYEVLCCRNNCDVEYLVGAEHYRLKKGDVVLIPPGVSHRPILPEEMTEPYKRDVLWISPEFTEMLPEEFHQSMPLPQGSLLLRTAGTKWEFIGDLFRTGVFEAEQREPGWETAVMGNTLQIIVQLHRARQDRSPLKAEQPDLLDRVMAYVEEHLSEQITLAGIAKRFFVSESTISHLFKERMGVSFYRCVTQRRLIAAKTMIQENANLEDAGRRSGFLDYSTFYRAFRKEYGISPRQYRRMYDSEN